MENEIKKDVIIVGFSFILGLIFGGIYDIMMLVQSLCGISSTTGGKRIMRRGKLPFLTFFFLDGVYMTTVGLTFSAFVYWSNHGAFRWFMAAGCAAGVFVWSETAGRILSPLLDAAARIVRFFAHRLLVRPIGILLRWIARGTAFLFRMTVMRLGGWIVRLYRIRKTNRFIRRLGETVAFPMEYKKEENG